MPRAIEIYQQFATLEWCNKYYIPDVVAITASTLAQNLANAQKPLQSTAITYSRYRFMAADGSLVEEGSLTGTGSGTGDMMPIHYAMLIRLQGGTEIGRPSVKYIHGWLESFQANNVPTATQNSVVAAFGTALNGLEVANSNGIEVTSVQFRGYTRRKRMRALGT